MLDNIICVVIRDIKGYCVTCTFNNRAWRRYNSDAGPHIYNCLSCYFLVDIFLHCVLYRDVCNTNC
jgi:hypothetical protein